MTCLTGKIQLLTMFYNEFVSKDFFFKFLQCIRKNWTLSQRTKTIPLGCSKKPKWWSMSLLTSMRAKKKWWNYGTVTSCDTGKYFIRSTNLFTKLWTERSLTKPIVRKLPFFFYFLLPNEELKNCKILKPRSGRGSLRIVRVVIDTVNSKLVNETRDKFTGFYVFLCTAVSHGLYFHSTRFCISIPKVLFLKFSRFTSSFRKKTERFRSGPTFSTFKK